jgi:hypothetical protein
MPVLAYIISEQTYSGKPEIISTTQEISQKKSVKFNETLQDADVKNRNTREYEKSGLEEGLNRENVQELEARKSWFGEAGHPIDPSQARQLTIDPKCISHRINKHWWEGNLIKAQIETALSPFGYMLRDLVVEQNVEMAVSLRAVGNIVQLGNKIKVTRPMHIVTYDWVFYPSHKVAYKDQGFVNESATKLGNNMIMTESVLIPISGDKEKALSYIKDQSANFKLVSEFFGDFDNISVVDNKKVILESAGEKVIIPIEKYISNEIDSYINKKL